MTAALLLVAGLLLAAGAFVAGFALGVFIDIDIKKTEEAS